MRLRARNRIALHCAHAGQRHHGMVAEVDQDFTVQYLHRRVKLVAAIKKFRWRRVRTCKRAGEPALGARHELA